MSTEHNMSTHVILYAYNVPDRTVHIGLICNFCERYDRNHPVRFFELALFVMHILRSLTNIHICVGFICNFRDVRLVQLLQTTAVFGSYC